MRDLDFFTRKYYPTASTLMFIEADIEVLQKEFMVWSLEIAQMWFPDKPKPSSKWVQGDIASKLECLLPLTRSNSKRLVCQTASNWLAYFTSDYHYPDEAGFNYMVDHLKARRLRFVLCEDNLFGASGSTQFGYKDCSKLPKKFRYVATHMESRWEFEQGGEPFPFEELETYKAKKIRDRLTPEMLERYAKHFGIDLFDPDFYTGRAFLLEYPTDPPTKTLDRFPLQIPGFTYY